MKPKTAFESGNSPPKVSKNGAPIQTGRGLEETKRRIMEAFENIRHHLPAPPQPPPQEPQVKTVYTDHHEAHFRALAKHLTLAALPSSHIGKTPRGDGSEIVVPTEGAEQLIAEAIRRFK